MYDILPRVTFLNGPAQVGKDTLANLICKDHRFRHLKMSRRLKDALRPFMYTGLADFDDDKIKSSDLHGTTVRRALISLSEDWAKPTFGPDIFGRLLAYDMEILLTDNPKLKFILSDSRFEEECIPVLKLCGNGLIVHIKRPGYGFQCDSGSYIKIGDGVPVVEIMNDRAPEEMVAALNSAASKNR
jgi:hypothetical protein